MDIKSIKVGNNVYRFYDSQDNNHVVFICKARSNKDANEQYIKYIREQAKETFIKEKDTRIGIHCVHINGKSFCV